MILHRVLISTRLKEKSHHADFKNTFCEKKEYSFDISK